MMLNDNILEYVPDRPCPVVSSCFATPAEPVDVKGLIPDANLRRRMGSLLRLAVGCGMSAIRQADSRELGGIITSTGLGFMKDTVNFADMIIDRQEDMLNPSPFMQSTFNTASGYIAMLSGNRTYNATYVHRSGGFAAALIDALMLVEDSNSNVLVGGFDEATPEVDEYRRKLGCWKRFNSLGEGAGFLCLGGDDSGVRILGVHSSATEVACDSKVLCSSYGDRLGAFFSILPVVLCIVIGERQPGLILVVDDVNPGGPAVLLEID
ncbi:MAG: beta-ketoacyl synthase chain length factor [Candidatus Cryptobacteroides sp.]